MEIHAKRTNNAGQMDVVVMKYALRIAPIVGLMAIVDQVCTAAAVLVVNSV